MNNPEVIELELLNGTQLNSESIVFLPLGSHESHGYHAPLGTDSIIAYEIAKTVARRVSNGLLLPVLNYGYSILHENFQGTISVSAQTLIAFLEDILCSLAKQGIHRIVIVNGHDGNVPCIDIAATNTRHKYSSCKIVVTTWWQISKECKAVEGLFGQYGGKGHGGAEEVALLLSIGRGKVDHLNVEPAEILTIQNRMAAPFLRHDITLIFQDMAEITGKSYEGVPSEATAEKGQFIFDYITDKIFEFLKEMNWHE